MEKRKNKRIEKRMIAHVNSKLSLIDNLSRSGIKFYIPFIPDNDSILIKLRTNDKTISLKGSIRWSSERIANQGLKEIGVILEAPPTDYSHFVDNLMAG